MSREDIAERFKRDTAEHVMTIRHDDGLYRHLQFSNPDRRWAYWFQIITVPNALIFRGDGESFVFSRLEDMFAFFRGPIGHINPTYWAEKLTSDRDSVMKYSQDLFNQHVADDLKQAEADWPGVTAAWEKKVSGFFAEYNTEYEHDARAALNDFQYLPEGATGEPFRFQDAWEWQLKEYHWWFLWALHGIVWGIAQYDAAKAASEDTYLVWSNEHRCWWGPNRSGYAQDVWKAGRYDRESAAAICQTRSWPQDAPPPEVMVLAPEAGRGAFTVDDFRVLPEMMRQRVEEATGKAISDRDADQSAAVTA
ncbi:hypothetical protein Sme01_03970 [Sphaerisporangium melleum]|uniref:Uncharacterized protein n=1 Tax=Sphaerisporangium melleum TaxID=321316 RepID=A0A917QPS5_9ACTN|nr:hypothetical protein [Sphaerisporangium melleum]GGK62034.1 hypothetical protein GCM10007964_01520 [Sphaerisporangium melleum]GII67921.1 hypothetical protein Sme01_03970 [Sphaerisporangium melleum]